MRAIRSHFILRHGSFRVSITDDPAEVLQLPLTAHFDALLPDNWMPKINAIELCRLIRSRESETADFLLLWRSHRGR